MNIINKADELIKDSQALKINAWLLNDAEASKYIHNVIKKYHPRKIIEHLAIDGDSVSVPVEKCEFSYSDYLSSEPAYIFFAQTSRDRNKVVVISDAQKICKIMENSYPMEYFVSNKTFDYLFAINWYVVEGAGSAKDLLLNF